MIGVVSSAAQAPAIGEFFELFKTPWEFYRSGTIYDVIVCSDARRPSHSARLTIIYGSREYPSDSQDEIHLGAQLSNIVICYKGDRIPLYGNCRVVSGSGTAALSTESGDTIALESSSSGGTLVRLGFDLFREVEELLQNGQPVGHAQIPTLDLQIAVLRDLILRHAAPFWEIPPVPSGHRFIVCLTHDVDNYGIRNHRFDHTVIGFLSRALFGSIASFCTRRKSAREVLANWTAAFSLPLVYLGIIRDFWETIDQYLKIEKGLPSTFFFVSKKDDPGRPTEQKKSPWRAVRYDLSKITEQISKLISAGCEIGLHGIDAWSDTAEGRNELDAIRKVTNESDIGVRMHWLYRDERSPALLDQAGFSYDSTVGYNETVGYRAGTTQAYLPLGAERMLELPMHIMDTALFYPAYMNLRAEEARPIFDKMIANAIRFGGVLTINWHDRSVAPDRLWDRPYIKLLAELKKQGAWFATAAQVVRWFRKRRSAALDEGAETNLTGRGSRDELPGLQIRRHNSASPGRDPSPIIRGETPSPELTLSERAN